MKIAYKFILLSVFVVTIIACNKNNDDGIETVPPRDRGVEAVDSQAEIEEYLQTHFYNYEEFQNPTSDFDYNIRFDTIAGENSTKTPLIDQVQFKTVKDRFDSDVSYKFYYLVAQQGGGESANFPDIYTATYEGRYINKENNNFGYSNFFDGSVVPFVLDLTRTVNGFQDGMVEFNSALSVTVNEDGTLSADTPGIGAIFIPAGLGYYVTPPSGIPLYAQLIFTFQVFDVRVGDQDNDGIPSTAEDLNGNGFEEDDDTDGDLVPNFADNDDDNDGRPTIEEIEIAADGTITYPDEDGDGIVDYLDSDS